MTFTIRRSSLVILVVLLMIGLGLFAASRATAASSTPVVYVAVGDNFPDALGAASAAAVQGGPVLLVQKDTIPSETKGELSRLAPDVIYVSGGTAVISDSVFNALKAYAPSVVRVAGNNRYGTAAAVSQSAFPVTGGVGGGDVASLTASVNMLISQVNGLAGRIDTLETENAALKATLAGVSRDGDTLLFTGMNLQVTNGAGQTHSSSNGLGNVIIGYNEDPGGAQDRTGSHYLVVGFNNGWSAYGGIVAGVDNSSNAPWASVTGGRNNVASGEGASVSGGYANTGSGFYASVVGGQLNHASGQGASIAGGSNNTATGDFSSITGGSGNEVVGDYDTIVGGDDKTNISWDGAIVIGEGFWDPVD